MAVTPGVARVGDDVTVGENDWLVEQHPASDEVAIKHSTAVVSSKYYTKRELKQEMQTLREERRAINQRIAFLRQAIEQWNTGNPVDSILDDFG